MHIKFPDMHIKFKVLDQRMIWEHFPPNTSHDVFIDQADAVAADNIADPMFEVASEDVNGIVFTDLRGPPSAPKL